jgi:hypothetical protein
MHLATSLVPTWTVTPLEPIAGLLGPGHVRRAMRWHVPAGWGTTDATVRRRWRSFVDASIVDVDQFYADVASELMRGMSGAQHQIVLQSAVATDTHGHFHGSASLASPYHASLNAGIGRARALRGTGWSMLVTSDHGGHDTPHWWRLTGAAVQSGVSSVTLHAGKIVLEGDHVVGYATGTIPPTIQRIDWAATPAALVPVSALPGGLVANSFHAAQRPDWIVLPEDDAMITDAPVLHGGGGSHGGSVDMKVMSPALSTSDGEVPLWWLGTAGAGLSPSKLTEVAAFFLALR